MSGDLWQQLSLPSCFDAGGCFASKVSRSSWKMCFRYDLWRSLLTWWNPTSTQLLQTYQGFEAMHSKRTLQSQGLSSALISDRCRFFRLSTNSKLHRFQVPVVEMRYVWEGNMMKHNEICKNRGRKASSQKMQWLHDARSLTGWRKVLRWGQILEGILSNMTLDIPTIHE